MNKKDFWNAIEVLSPPLFKTYSVINELCNNDVDYCFSGGEYLEKKIGKDKDNITKDIAKLVDLGFLHRIYIKIGFKIIERRLYTAKQYKTYVEDLENLENLVVTTYEKSTDGEIIYSNERSYTKNAYDKNFGGADDKNIGGADDENVGQIDTNINNKIINSKTEEPVPVSEIESKINFVCEIEKIKLDSKFIKELSGKYELPKVIELIKLVPKDFKNAGAYIRGIIKNQGLENKKPKPAAHSVGQKITENTENQVIIKDRDSIITEYFQATGFNLKNIPNLQKNILNDTLRRSGYESI